MTHEKNIDAILGGFHTAGNDNDADFPVLKPKFDGFAFLKYIFSGKQPIKPGGTLEGTTKGIDPAPSPDPYYAHHTETFLEQKYSKYADPPATPDYSIPQSETNVPGLGVEDTYDSTPPAAVAPPSPEMSEGELIEKLPTVEDSSQTGLIDQIIGLGWKYSESKSVKIKALLDMLIPQVELDGLVELTAEQEGKLLGVLLLEPLGREPCALIEKVLLSPTLKNPDLFAVSGKLFETLDFLENGYSKKIYDSVGGFPEFVYQFAKAHQHSEFYPSPKPLIHKNIYGYSERMYHIAYSAKRMIEDELGRDVADRFAADSAVLDALAKAIYSNPTLYYSLPIEVAQLYESHRKQGHKYYSGMYGYVLGYWSSNQRITLQDYLNFAFNQLTGDKGIDELMIYNKLPDLLSAFGTFKGDDAYKSWETNTYGFFELLKTRNPQPFIDQFFTTIEKLDEEQQDRIYETLYHLLIEQIVGSEFVSLDHNDDLFLKINKEQLRMVIDYFASDPTQLLPGIQLLRKDVVTKDPDVILAILSQFDPQIETWSSDPQLQAIGLTEKSELFAALYYGWTVEDVTTLSTSLNTFFSLTPDTALSWNSFPWKDESLKSFTAADVNEDLLQSYADKLPVYAQSKEYDAGRLVAEMTSVTQFLSQISQGSIDSLQTIPSFELINFLEPEWFNVVCESVQTTPEEYETSIAPLTADIEALLAPYLKDKEIDTPDGIWRHSKTILRDKDSLEDQMMHLTIVEKDGQAKLQISFKLTSVCLKENQEKIAGLSRVERVDVVAAARDKSEQRLTQLKEKLDSLGHFCSNCGVYHFHGDLPEQKLITKLADIGFTAEEYENLITKLKSGWGQSSAKKPSYISFTSTSTAIKNLEASEEYRLEATQKIAVSDDVLVSVFDHKSASTGYIGTTRFDINFDEETTTKSVATKLAIIMKMMGIADALSPVTPESRRALAVNRYRWNRRTKEVPPETAERLEYTAITKDYSTFVEPGFHEQLVREGLNFIYSTHGTAKGAIGLFRLGLLSSNERRRLGLIRGGVSIPADINSGGSDFAFARIMVANKIEKIGVLRALWDVSAMDRTDYFACHKDNYGRTFGELYSNRPTPTEYVQGQMQSFMTGNEVCFKKAIGADKLVLVQARGQFEKMEIVEELAKRGTTHHRGVPIEDCIIVIDREMSDGEYAQAVQAAYDQLRERYKQLEVQQMNGKQVIDELITADGPVEGEQVDAGEQPMGEQTEAQQIELD